MGKTIAICNQKGGVAKTTTSIAMATILKSKGYKTLLIDADKQCNSSDTFGASIEGEATLYDVILAEEKVPISEAIQHLEYGDIVPSDKLLKRAEVALSGGDADANYRLADAIDEVKDMYDFIIIDTAPSIDSLLVNCLAAADEVIVPITAERYSIQGLSQLLESIYAVKKRINKGIMIAGLLMTRFNARTRLSAAFLEPYRNAAEMIGTKLFDSMIRETTVIKEAQNAKKPLDVYAPRAAGTQDYINFVDEFLAKEGK